MNSLKYVRWILRSLSAVAKRLTTNRRGNMEWLKIDFSNLPKGEVLAANFNTGAYGYKEKIIGYLGADGSCENEHEMLMNCTHYIDINKHDI